MYKVFVNGLPLYFTGLPNPEDLGNRQLVLTCDGLSELELLQELLENGKLPVQEVWVTGPDHEVVFRQYQTLFMPEEAAGGCVANEDGRLLAIRRPAYASGWDLPKGKCEAGESPLETAIREIREECGAGALQWIKDLPPTYHTFFRSGKRVFKRTHWFAFGSATFDPRPQVSEGIAEASWISPDQFRKKMAFPSLEDILDACC